MNSFFTGFEKRAASFRAVEKELGHSLPKGYKRAIKDKKGRLRTHELYHPEQLKGMKDFHKSNYGTNNFTPLGHDGGGNEIGIKKGDKTHLYDWFHENQELTPVGKIDEIFSGKVAPSLKYKAK